MSVLKDAAKAVIAKTPYRVLRGRPNRFDAIEATLGRLVQSGFRPRTVIDGGAHLGSFALVAASIFDGAEIHMVEPQPACRADLQALSDKRGFKLHPYALAAQSGEIRMWAAGDVPSTGSSVAETAFAEDQVVTVQAETLDRLTEDGALMQDGALLKLDLQGYELEALKGATHMLRKVEILLTEVSFFAQAYEPSPLVLMSFLHEAGFDLYDVAALSGRARDDRLKQGDFVFVRRRSRLATDTSWD